MSTSPHVIIIGAGTGGLCLAQGLKQAGVKVTVSERDRTRRDGLQGYRVGISPDGSRALHACLPPELWDVFVATCARKPFYFGMWSEQLRELLVFGPELTEGQQPPEPDPIAQDRSVSRMTLRQVLLTGLEDVVQFDKTFTHYEQRPDGTVTAFFDDGTSATGDVLVAADGSNSRVRGQYLPDAKLVDAKLIGLVGKTPLTEETRKLLPDKVFNGISIVSGPGGYSTIIHVMEFPWGQDGKPKDTIGGTNSELIESWPGLLYDNTRDYIMWSFGSAQHKMPADLMGLKGPQLRELVIERTTRWHPNLRKLFLLGDTSTIFPINIRTSEPIPQWKTTTITLLGDAIHTMTPGRGIGANTALRDARLLCENLVKAREGGMTLLDAIHDYETQMVEYGFDAVIKSRSAGTGDDAVYKPVIGPIVAMIGRTGMRLVNNLPRQMKMKIAENMDKDRDQEKQKKQATA
ncbi:2-polyprenyl-6-methoxyphenol hydroxylase-like FAD-dependent oxidoreductase [Kutzneria viridogrisea]|uniref:2-polyprenyl-6-methoxyphenol hydroxylase-like FAD-dependent oxidoreductase n=2 Tax=Kutzneria viridogrisea TaxID=47990 RepID=A0ABR6BY37_9PSEU|nr:2-polyprenyl-6-methoxyphenol hydroxylase-like FAD-dependent oxidoreductase [Kutzneria viridogrisea]